MSNVLNGTSDMVFKEMISNSQTNRNPYESKFNPILEQNEASYNEEQNYPNYKDQSHIENRSIIYPSTAHGTLIKQLPGPSLNTSNIQSIKMLEKNNQELADNISMLRSTKRDVSNNHSYHSYNHSHNNSQFGMMGNQDLSNKETKGGMMKNINKMWYVMNQQNHDLYSVEKNLHDQIDNFPLDRTQIELEKASEIKENLIRQQYELEEFAKQKLEMMSTNRPPSNFQLNKSLTYYH